MRIKKGIRMARGTMIRLMYASCLAWDLLNFMLAFHFDNPPVEFEVVGEGRVDGDGEPRITRFRTLTNYRAGVLGFDEKDLVLGVADGGDVG